jgi:hypothetical protein
MDRESKDDGTGCLILIVVLIIAFNTCDVAEDAEVQRIDAQIQILRKEIRDLSKENF